MSPVLVRPPEPYDFLASVRAHGWVWLAPFAPSGSGFHRVERLACSGRVVSLEVTAGLEHGSPAVRASAGQALSPEEEREIAAKLRWMLRLDEDLSEFSGLCSRRGDHYRAAVGRGRLLRSPTLFEDALKVILTTNTTWRQTIAMVARTVAALGEPVPGDPAQRAFPTPGAVRAAGEGFFREQVRVGYRAGAVVALAERAGELEALRGSDLPTPDLRRRLLGFRGVGPYAAATLLMLLGRYDYLAVDSELRAFTARKYFGGRPTSEREVQALYAEWGRWRYLGYWLDSDEAGQPFTGQLGDRRVADPGGEGAATRPGPAPRADLPNDLATQPAR